MAINNGKSLTWTNIDPSSMPATQQKLYNKYKAQYKLMKEAREAFENSFQEAAPEGKRYVFGYNFGKLAIALDVAKNVKTPVKEMSLKDFLKSAS